MRLATHCELVIPRTVLAVVGAFVVASALVACSSTRPSATTHVQQRPTSPSRGTPTTTTTAAPRVVVTTTTPTSVVEQPGWTAAATDAAGIAVDTRTVVLADGSIVTVARFRAGRTKFVLHVGSQDPPSGGLALGQSGGATVAGLERLALLGAFNGGFKSNAGAGGFEIFGTVLRPLRPGAASFVIDANGAGHVGVWGYDLPRPGEAIVSSRQNLTPLVHDSQPSPQIGQVWNWGATLGRRSFVARSALAEDGQSNILYAASMSSTPADLASALVQSGATNAMELDINPQWVQLALAPSPGGPLHIGVPGQHRPADQYLLGWTRDFITVLATSAHP